RSRSPPRRRRSPSPRRRSFGGRPGRAVAAGAGAGAAMEEAGGAEGDPTL
ncbi:unnamed protein product, partial [Ascophyllum nodosum]